MSELPEIRRGHQRSFRLCVRHNMPAFYDYVPYSLANPITVMPCGCSARDAEHISEERFTEIARTFSSEKDVGI